MSRYKKLKDSTHEVYIDTKYEDEILHIIKTGNLNTNAEDIYLVIHEDAHQITIGTCRVLTHKEIKEGYNIDL